MRFFPLDHEKGAKCAFDNFRKESDRERETERETERESEQDRANSAFSRATVCNKDNYNTICLSIRLSACLSVSLSVCLCVWQRQQPRHLALDLAGNSLKISIEFMMSR